MGKEKTYKPKHNILSGIMMIVALLIAIWFFYQLETSQQTKKCLNKYQPSGAYSAEFIDYSNCLASANTSIATQQEGAWYSLGIFILLVLYRLLIREEQK